MKRTDEEEDREEEENARIALEKIIDGSVKNSDWGDQSGQNDLGRQDFAHLANETPSEQVLSVAETGVKRFPLSAFQIYLEFVDIFAPHVLVAQHLSSDFVFFNLDKANNE